MEHGWDVKVFSFKNGPVYVTELSAHVSGVNKNLSIPPFLYSKSTSNQILNWMCGFLHESNENVIESDSVLISFWGELLAKRLRGKHLLFLIDETPIVPSYSRNYIDFKFKRHEFSCITTKTLLQTFPDAKIERPENYILTAYCSNSIDDVNNSHLEIEFGNGAKIGLFGRIDKPYVKPVSLRIIEYARKHPELNFEIVYIGGSLSGKAIRRIEKLYHKCNNIKLHFTGFLCPVPRKFLDNFDFFIGSSGSAYATYISGYLTIAIDAYKYQANGLVGIHTKNTLSPTPVQYRLEDLFDDLIISKKYSRDHLTSQPVNSLDYYFDPHLKYLYNYTEGIKKEYFDIEMIKLPYKYKILRVLIDLMGTNISNYLLSLVRSSNIFKKMI